VTMSTAVLYRRCLRGLRVKWAPSWSSAVDISSAPEGNAANDTLQILLQTFSIMGKSIYFFELRDVDVVVRPSLIGVASADFGARRRALRPVEWQCRPCFLNSVWPWKQRRSDFGIAE
jgi:hypothetical protein